MLGISQFQGVAGSLFNSVGAELAYGILGFKLGASSYGVYAGGNFGGTGAKYFVEPHPTDASKVIRSVSLEGPEAGTYFRGRGKFQNGLATIDVPEDFRMVTDSEGLSIQVTQIGELATVAVVRIDLEGILVKASRNKGSGVRPMLYTKLQPAMLRRLFRQRIVSRIGNIYRAEALFVDGIHPLRPASSLTPAELLRLWATEGSGVDRPV